jgi:hypothetical protein
MWANEYTVFDGDSVVNRDIVLDFGIISDGDTRIHIYPFAHDTVLSNPDVFTDLSLVPDAGAISNGCPGAHFSGRMNTNSHVASVFGELNKKGVFRSVYILSHLFSEF